MSQARHELIGFSFYVTGPSTEKLSAQAAETRL